MLPFMNVSLYYWSLPAVPVYTFMIHVLYINQITLQWLEKKIYKEFQYQEIETTEIPESRWK